MSISKKRERAQKMAANADGLGQHDLVDSLRDIVLFNPEFKKKQSGKDVINVEPEFFEFDNLLPCPGEDPSTLRPVILVFLRRFGCPLCRSWACELSRIKPEFDKVGVRLVCIGIEEVGFQEFRDRDFFSGEIYIDMKGALFKRLHLRKIGVTSGFGLFDLRFQAALTIADNNVVDGNYEGNWFQLGGTFIVNATGDDFLLEYREQYAGDRPPWDLVFQLIQIDSERGAHSSGRRRENEESSGNSSKHSNSDSESSNESRFR